MDQVKDEQTYYHRDAHSLQIELGVQGTGFQEWDKGISGYGQNRAQSSQGAPAEGSSLSSVDSSSRDSAKHRRQQDGSRPVHTAGQN